MSYVDVQKSLYENFYSPSKGGVFCVQKVILYIRGCYFCNCSNPLKGGAIYANDCVSYVKNTKCDKCYITTHTRDYWGNSIYTISGKIEFDRFSMYMCGLPDNKCGDSAIFCQSLANLTYINSSYNYGINGGSFASLVYADLGSCIKHCNCYEPRDARTVETIRNVINIEYTNFINCSQVEDALLYADDNRKFVLSYCVIWNLGNKLLCYSNYQVLVYNSKSNTLTQNGFTFISTITTFQNLINIKLDFRNNYVTCHYYNYLSKFQSCVFIFVLVLIK